MDHDKEVASSMLAAIASPGFKDTAKELAEAVADTLTTSELLQRVPIVSTLAGLASAAGRVRDVFLARKILTFLIGVADADENARQDFFEKHCTSEDRRQQLSTLVLHVLDELRDEERVALVAALFVGLLDNVVDHEDFSSLCDAATRLSRKHVRLLRLLDTGSPQWLVDSDSLYLQLHGLIIQDWTPHGEGPGPRFILSRRGSTLLRVVSATAWYQA